MKQGHFKINYYEINYFIVKTKARLSYDKMIFHKNGKYLIIMDNMS